MVSWCSLIPAFASHPTDNVPNLNAYPCGWLPPCSSFRLCPKACRAPLPSLAPGRHPSFHVLMCNLIYVFMKISVIITVDDKYEYVTNKSLNLEIVACEQRGEKSGSLVFTVCLPLRYRRFQRSNSVTTAVQVSFHYYCVFEYLISLSLPRHICFFPVWSMFKCKCSFTSAFIH